MNKIYSIFILILVTINSSAKIPDTYDDELLSFANLSPQSVHQADSIMRYVIEHASQYADAVSRYEAEIYIRGRAEILKQNKLIRYGNHLFPVDRNKSDIIFEMVSESEYIAPNHFRHNLKAVNGNSLPNRKKQEEILTFLNLNIYSPTMYNETILSPIGKKAFSYYKFNLEDVDDSEETPIYKIRFLPKHWSQKLVSGDLYIRGNDWTITKVDMHGRYSFAEFNLVMTFGHQYGQLILPEKADIHLRYKVLGNTVASSYHSSFNYKEVEWQVVKPKEGKEEWKPLDLSQYYTLLSDSIPVIQDEEYWKGKRDISLTEEEEKVYEIHYPKSGLQKRDSTDTIDYLEVTEKLASTIRFNLPTTHIRYSGILNPLQLGYSPRNGITYKQRVRITQSLPGNQQLIFRPEIGYVFSRKELFYKFRSDWLYAPEKRGALSLNLANANQTYSSMMMQDINESLKDSLFNFKDLNLKFYRHHYIKLHNSIELSNGLELGSGLSFHQRIPVKKKSKADVDPGDEIEDMIYDTYYDFIPSISLTYTPRQFYRIVNKKKEYAYSYYPTMSVIVSRGVPKVFNSSGNYTRIEGDIHQSLRVGPLRRLNYHLSGGFYTRKKSIYFAEFDYFTRSNFPNSWGDDEIGGVFHLLNREWFNASDEYIQTHLMYESPFLLFKLFNKTTSRWILTERLYLGYVWTPALSSYTEIGYGFGNQIFNIAVFTGLKKGEYQQLGLRFSFELGK